MKKINGITIIEPDYIGEVPRMGDAKLIRSACNRFLASRGIPILDGRDTINAHAMACRARKKARARAEKS